MATGSVNALAPILFKSVTRQITQNATNDTWTMNNVEFPSKAGYSRVIVGLRSDNQDLVVTGWVFSDTRPQWQTRKLVSSAVTCNVYATMLYLPDRNQW